MHLQRVIGVLLIALPVYWAGRDIYLYRLYSKLGWPTEGKTEKELRRMLRVGKNIAGFLPAKRTMAVGPHLQRVEAALTGDLLA